MKTPSVLQQISTSISFVGYRFSSRTPPSIFSMLLPATTIASLFLLSLAAPLQAQFAYVANADSGNVSAYGIDSNGVMTAVPGSPFAAGVEPFSVAVDLTAKFAYVANFSGNNVSAYSIGSRG